MPPIAFFSSMTLILQSVDPEKMIYEEDHDVNPAPQIRKSEIVSSFVLQYIVF